MNYYGLFNHMKGSGVRDVMENIYTCLSENSRANIFLIYCEKMGKFSFPNVTVLNNPNVNYDDKKFQSKEEFDRYAIKVKDSIKAELDLSKKCIIHAHNINLVKNTYMGRALQFLADEQKDNPNFLLIIQIHDFAEDNRKDRLDLMQNCTGKLDKEFANKITYPIANNIIYCTINSRDESLLEKINIPKERIFLFPNNFDIGFLQSQPANAGLKRKIKEYAKNDNYIFDEKRKILLSPLKIIRRKNVIESLLILKLLNSIKDEWQLLITRNANSKADMEYSNKIKNYVKNNKLPVTIGFGDHIINPGKEHYNKVDLFSISNFILTTSKQEGFGMTYLEGWVAEKPIIARKIDFLCKDFKENGIHIDHFYEKIKINGKDFKDYTADEQISLLDTADYTKLQKEMKKIIDFINQDNTSLIQINKQAIINNYSLKAYYNNLTNMIEEGLKLNKKYPKTDIDNSYLIKFFSK